MKKRYLVGLACGVMMFGVARMAYATPIILETYVNPANGNTYNLLSSSTWTEAEASAILLGGHLVSINDAAENDWVFHTFGENRNLWIGLNEDATGFHWSDGDAVTYTNFWDYSHGYSNGEPYAVMGSGYSGRWDDWQNGTPWPVNNNPIFGVTEAPVPEPATMLLFGTGIAGLAGTRLRRKKS